MYSYYLFYYLNVIYKNNEHIFNNIIFYTYYKNTSIPFYLIKFFKYIINQNIIILVKYF